jgi:hypothetical protein
MNLKKIRPIVEVIVISILVFGMHKLFFYVNEENPKFQNFHFPIEYIYVFFFICSTIIIGILLFVKSKNIDNVGYIFLWVTTIKMAISYAILYPILNSGNINVNSEKINFFIIFALFLTIETVVTIRMLNNNQ